MLRYMFCRSKFVKHGIFKCFSRLRAYTQSELDETVMTMTHFRQVAKFLGFSGSSGPSQSARRLFFSPVFFSVDEIGADEDIAGQR
jgi:hypothetical protein